MEVILGANTLYIFCLFKEIPMASIGLKGMWQYNNGLYLEMFSDVMALETIV